MYVYDGKPFDIYKPQLVGDVNYPAGWFEDESQRSEHGILAAIVPPAPSITSSQKVEIEGFEENEGVYVARWRIISKTPEEIGDDFARRMQTLDAKWFAIKEERDRRKFAGVKVDDHWFHSDTFSRTQWLGMLLQGQSLGEYEWSTIDNGTVTTTPLLAMKVAQAIAVQDATLFAVARTKKEQMLASDDPATFDAYANWPKGYGE